MGAFGALFFTDRGGESQPQNRGREILRKWKIPITGFYYGILRFITDITEFYYGYYGTFLKDFVDSGPRPSKKARKALIFGENQEKSGQFITDITEYYGYYGNGYYGILRNITVRNISLPLPPSYIGSGPG